VNAVRRAGFGVLLAGLAALACLLFGSGFASADTHIIVGGNTDCTSQGLANTIAAQGRLQGDPVPVAYGTCDGDFAPFSGSTTPNDAFNQGVAATRAAWDQHCANGSRCVIEGFSYGDAPAIQVASDVGADQPGSNTRLITNGNAWGDPGVFGPTPGPIGVGINVGAAVIGVPANLPVVPNSENRNDVNDAYGSNGGQPPWAEITQLSTINGADTNGDGVQDIPPQHNVPNGPITGSYVDENNVTNNFYGDPLPGVVPPADNPVVNPPVPDALVP
jgi:hypothetical protein